jgi:hypothetical protein
MRIDKALNRLKAELFRSEFLELRYDIRTVLGDAGKAPRRSSDHIK